MNQRINSIVLLASFSLMVSGLSIAAVSAQNEPLALPMGGAPPAAPAAGAAGKIQPFRTGLEGTKQRRQPPGARVSFNLEDADLPDLVRLISSITGKRFILPSKARSIKATIYSPQDVTAAEAYQAFLSILSMNGLTLEPSGRYYKIAESTQPENRVLPLYTDGEALPADERFVTRMHRLQNVSAEDAVALLTHFKTPEGAVTAYPATNSIIMSDTGLNIRRMLRILSEIDIPRSGEQVWIEPLEHAAASDLASRLQEILPTAAKNGGSQAKQPVTEGAQPTSGGSASRGEMRLTNIIADERTNSLIIVGTERGYLRALELIRALDTEVEGGGGTVHVHGLQYAQAEQMATMLQTLMQGRGGAPAGGGSGAAPGQVSIQPHKDTNSLVITASQSDYAQLRRVIAELDVAPRQVFIEAVIMELQVQRSSRLGLSYHGGLPEPGVDGQQSLSVLGFNSTGSLGFPASALSGDTLSGLAVGVRGPNIPQIPGIGLSIPSFGVVLNALAGSSDADVLSTPHLMAMDNVEAEINVGANVPTQTSVGIGGGGLGGLAGLAGLAGTQTGASNPLGALGGLGGLSGLGGGFGMGQVPRQQVGTKVRITPHINDTGEIRMEIEEEISEASPPDPNSPLGVVTIQQRTAKTQVLVRDQQTVVIGGLMRDRVSTRETKVPILGDIPILGMLFRTESRETTKTNLLMFLTPYVVRGPEDLRSIFERHLRERQEFIDRYFVFGDDHDYRPPLDYSRTRGLLGEIRNELGAIDDERRLQAELENQPAADHRPRAPVGSEAMDGMMIIGPNGPEAMENDAGSPASGATTPPSLAPAPAAQAQPQLAL